MQTEDNVLRFETHITFERRYVHVQTLISRGITCMASISATTHEVKPSGMKHGLLKISYYHYVLVLLTALNQNDVQPPSTLTAAQESLSSLFR
jgi:hypothetical protein